MGLTHEERINIRMSLASRLPTAAQALADALDDMLDLAVERYGPRDGGFTVVALAFGDDHPSVSYPNPITDPPCRAQYARVRLSEGALSDVMRGDLHKAFWQLAHESVHLLSPTPGRRVSVLEEGLACCFQHDYMRAYPDYDVPGQHMPSYIEAESVARRVLSLDADVVRKARRLEPTIGRIVADCLRACCPALPYEEARALTERFYRHGPPPEDGPWPFQEPKTTVVVTTEAVAEYDGTVLLVERCIVDGLWQFQDGSGEKPVVLVSLEEVLHRDPSLAALADLPQGWRAWRHSLTGTWERDVMGGCPRSGGALRWPT